MNDVLPPDPDRPDVAAGRTPPGVEPPTVSAVTSGLPSELPPRYEAFPSEAPVAPLPVRRGPLGLAWPWWLAGGCGLLLLCCLCSLLLLGLFAAAARATPAPVSTPRAPTRATATPRPAGTPRPSARTDVTAPFVEARLASSPIGSVAPDFALTTLDGQTVSLSDFRGRPVVVNFWASWCGPCKAEMPLLSRTYEELKDSGLVLLAVDVQEPEATVRRYVEDNGLPFTILLDPGLLSEHYRVRFLPTTYFIDADGVIQSWQQGALSQTFLTRHLERIQPTD